MCTNEFIYGKIFTRYMTYLLPTFNIWVMLNLACSTKSLLVSTQVMLSHILATNLHDVHGYKTRASPNNNIIIHRYNNNLGLRTFQ